MACAVNIFSFVDSSPNCFDILKHLIIKLDCQKYRKMNGQIDRQTDRQKDGQTDGQKTDRQTDGQTNKQTNGQTDR